MGCAALLVNIFIRQLVRPLLIHDCFVLDGCQLRHTDVPMELAASSRGRSHGVDSKFVATVPRYLVDEVLLVMKGVVFPGEDVAGGKSLSKQVSPTQWT